jgi:aspartyl-tRNA(Asn)/glutamyl-tRNA(Gln) amidotransferase subunit A
VTDPADLGVVEAAALLGRRGMSSSELTHACLHRIRERDGTHSHEGDPSSINAWVRVYEEDALAAAARADARLAEGPAPALCGIPFGLKDLYAVAGKPLTASSRLLDETPSVDSDVAGRLLAQGMVLLGHLHTHEFAIGGTTDQVGNPWDLTRTAGGSSGGSAAALAARMVPAATGSDTAGSLRIPSALSGTSTIKPTQGLVSLAGIVPLSPTLDHPGPMARTVADCALLLEGMAPPGAFRWDPQDARTSLEGVRLALSPRTARVKLDPDVADGFATAVDACRRLGATVLEAPRPTPPLEAGPDYLDVVWADLLPYHRRFDARRELYRPALREWVENAERRATSAEDYEAIQERRAVTTAEWSAWLARERISAVLEPTVAVVAPLRGDGYEHAGSDVVLILLTHFWNWTGFPVVALPSGLGSRSGLPTSVSLVGPAGSDADLARLGVALQGELGVPVPPMAALAP